MKQVSPQKYWNPRHQQLWWNKVSQRKIDVLSNLKAFLLKIDATVNSSYGKLYHLSAALPMDMKIFDMKDPQRDYKFPGSRTSQLLTDVARS